MLVELNMKKANMSQYRKNLVISFLVIAFQCGLFTAQGVRAETTNAEPDSYKGLAIGASSLVLQPIYLAAKLAIGAVGTIISGVTLVATAGNEELAKEIFDKSWAGPWGVPDLFKPTEMEPSKN